MDRLKRKSCPNGEMLQGKAKKKRFKEGEILKITEESSPLVGMLLTFISGGDIIRAELVESGQKVLVPVEFVERAEEVRQ